MSVNTEVTLTQAHACNALMYSPLRLDRDNVVCWMIRMLQPTHTIGKYVYGRVRAHSFMHRLPYSISICLAERVSVCALATKPAYMCLRVSVCECVSGNECLFACVCNEKNSKNKENTTNYKWFDVTSETETAMNATHGSQMVTA